jgi:hypothetical protein
MGKTPHNISHLLTLGPKELSKQIRNTILAQEHIKEYITVYGISKEELMKACKWSQNQYYRRLKKMRLSELETIVRLADKAK